MFQFRAILKTLVEHEVEFILVGGLAGVLQGAPVNTAVRATKSGDAVDFLRSLSAFDAVPPF